MRQQALAVGVARLDRRRRRGTVRDDDRAGGLVDPAEGRHVHHRAVEDAALAHPGLGRPARLPTDQLVALLDQPPPHGRDVTGAQRSFEHRLRQAVDLHEHDAGDVDRLGPSPGPTGHRPVEPGVVVDGEDGRRHRRDRRQPDHDDQTGPEPVQGDTGQEVEHERHEDRIEDDGTDPEGQHGEGHHHDGERRPDDRVHQADDEAGQEGIGRAVDGEATEQPRQHPQGQGGDEGDEGDPPEDPAPRGSFRGRPHEARGGRRSRGRWGHGLGHSESDRSGGSDVVAPGGRRSDVGPVGCGPAARGTAREAPGLHHAEQTGGADAGQLGVEATHGIAQPTRSPAPESDRAVGAPVDRDDEAGLHQLGRPAPPVGDRGAPPRRSAPIRRWGTGRRRCPPAPPSAGRGRCPPGSTPTPRPPAGRSRRHRPRSGCAGRDGRCAPRERSRW